MTREWARKVPHKVWKTFRVWLEASISYFNPKRNSQGWFEVRRFYRLGLDSSQSDIEFNRISRQQELVWYTVLGLISQLMTQASKTRSDFLLIKYSFCCVMISHLWIELWGRLAKGCSHLPIIRVANHEKKVKLITEYLSVVTWGQIRRVDDSFKRTAPISGWKVKMINEEG